ncbi:ABC transporter ATP-binding protein [Halobacteriales archaeon Cl-PHB]
MVSVDSVTKTYGDVVAVDDVSLDVDDGQFHCLLGPNGSGKTTLIRLVVGLDQPTRGSIDRRDAVIGCGFQQPSFYPDLTVSENLLVFARMLGVDDAEWRGTLTDELRLERALDRRAGDLSGGFARKLDLALAMLKRPDVLVLDEPLGALDDVSKERLLGFLGRYRDAGNTILVSTHHVTDFEPYLDRVTIMHDGDVVVDSALDALDREGHDSLQAFYVDLVLDREGVRAPTATPTDD